MKKLLVGFLMFVATGVWANNVTDTLSNGQTPVQGDILYYNSVSGNSAGTWAQPSSIPGLTGAAGAQGIQGVAGANGTNGTNGIDGINGTNGSIGPAGAAGLNGSNGTNGVDGVVG